jgi:hypothetical protein
VGRSDGGDWWAALANGTGTGSENQLWGHWEPVTWQDVGIADLNGDGKSDIVGRSAGGDWWAALANGAGTGSGNHLWGHWEAVPWLDVQVADVSGDGRADIVGRSEGGDWWVAKANDTGTGSVNQLWGHWEPISWSDVQAANVTGQDAALALMALDAPQSAAAAESLGQEQLTLVVEQAIQQWETAGLAAAQLAAFRDMQVAIADLPGLQLGMATSGSIILDVNAAGYGWYADANPLEDFEFVDTANSGCRPSTLDSRLQMNLLTAVMHELGHLAGLADDYGDLDSADVMSGWLLPGTRRLPTLADLDAVFGDSDWIAD